MMHLKACTRCSGDMLEEDLLGDIDIVCIQCGHRAAAPVVKYPIRARKPVALKRAA